VLLWKLIDRNFRDVIGYQSLLRFINTVGDNHSLRNMDRIVVFVVIKRRLFLHRFCALLDVKVGWEA